MSAHAVPADAYTTGLLSKDLPTELERLQLLEKTYDPGTVQALGRLPMRADWRCLEVGAGAGSIAYWLADRVPDGSVLAVDIDPRFIDADRAPQLEVRGSDITTDDFPAGSFDLIHARAVFMHLPRRREMIERAMQWLAPGGWLVLEDVHFLPAADSPYPAWQEVHGAYLTALAQQGIDLSWARRLPAELAAAGCEAVDVSVTPGGLGVDEVQDQLLGIRLIQSGPRLVEAGLVTAEQMAAAQRLVESGPAPDLSTFVYSAWGRKPAGPAQ
ncbi:class I SAM-dependent methyltransferase [Streptomyces olivaceiscleroticus]|uniref:Methyltransferase domain-containing protein n=1 Tax=Streptomyces olivaceiscleroticus TaxID=68245 RepID=A0ABP3K833_9ACTN